MIQNNIKLPSYKSIKISILFCLMLLLPYSALLFGLSDKKILTLDRCLSLAFSRNSQFRSSVYNLKSKKKNIDEAKANFYYPDIEVAGSYTYKEQSPKTTFPIANDKFSTSIKINKILYAFGRLGNQISIAEKNYTIAKLDLRQGSNDLIYNVKTAFYNVLLNQQNLKVIYEGHKILKQNLDFQKRNYNKGKSPKLDYLRVEIQYENDKINVRKAKKDLINSINRLFTLIGNKLISDLKSYNFKIKGQFYHSFDLSHRFGKPITLERLVERGKRSRVDVQKLYAQEKILKLNRGIVGSDWKPVLTAFSNLTTDWEKQTVFTATGFGLSNNLKRTTTYNIGIQLTLPLSEFLIPNSASRSKSKSFDYQIKSAQHLLSEGVKQASKEISANYLAFKEAEKNIKRRKRIVKLSKESFRIAQKKYIAGTLDYINFRDVEQQYRQARLDYVRELNQLSTAYLNLLKSLGEDLR